MRRFVLVTRPEPGLHETMAAVAALGLQPLACPLLCIHPRASPFPPATSLAATVITSSQAIPGLAADPALRRVPLFAVGDATAARARQAGFADSRSAAGDANDLASLVQASVPAGGRLLLATASGQGEALARTLRRAGFGVHRRVVYRSAAARALPPAAAAALFSDQIEACLFFSAATALVFGRLLPVVGRAHLATVRGLVISPAVGAALASLPWLRIETAARPDAASLLCLLRSPE